MRPLKVTVVLSSALANDPPHLDSLLERLEGERRGNQDGVSRARPAPEPGWCDLPLARERLGGFLVARASSPIFTAGTDAVGYVAKRFPADRADLLAPGHPVSVAVNNGTYKGYRLPVRRRDAGRVVWFCVGDADGLRAALAELTGLGSRRGIGAGAVAWIEVEPIKADWSWFAPSEAGPVLMRPLPVGPWLPEDLVGARRDFGACAAPYWHGSRYGEIVTPCA